MKLLLPSLTCGLARSGPNLWCRAVFWISSGGRGGGVVLLEGSGRMVPWGFIGAAVAIQAPRVSGIFGGRGFRIRASGPGARSPVQDLSPCGDDATDESRADSLMVLALALQTKLQALQSRFTPSRSRRKRT